MCDTSSPHAPWAGLPVQARLHQHQVLRPHDDCQDTPRRIDMGQLRSVVSLVHAVKKKRWQTSGRSMSW
jgi:hypothetical protein